MSRDVVTLLFDLPSLDFAFLIEVSGVSPSLRAGLEARWPPRTPEARISGVLALDAVPEHVGLPSAALVTADVQWTGTEKAEVITNGAAFSLSLGGGGVQGAGRVVEARARGGIEAAVRAASVIALAQRGVLVLHASAVHRGGDALVFLGPSSAGKTSTARRLGREGLQRIADDMIAIDLAAPRPTLHRLPFERAGRALSTTAIAGSRADVPIVCRGGALVRKGAPAAALVPPIEAPRVWADAVITLPPPPGAEPLLLARFLRLCALPLRVLEAPPSGPLAPIVVRWITSIVGIQRGEPGECGGGEPGERAEKRVDTASRPPETTGPGIRANIMDERDQAERRVSRAANVAWRVLDGMAVLVAPSSAKVQTLNPVGTLVWAAADGRALGEIVDAVVNEFEVERTQASVDVERFVLELEGKGLLIVQPTAKGSTQGSSGGA